MKVTVLGKCGLGKDESARERVNFKCNPRSYFLFRLQNASFSYIFARCTGQNFTWLLKTQCVMNTLRRRLDFHWKFFGERKELNCISLLVSLHTGQLRHCTRGAGPQETRLWKSNESLMQNTNNIADPFQTCQGLSPQLVHPYSRLSITRGACSGIWIHIIVIVSCGWGTSRIKSSNCGLCLEGSRLLCLKSFLTVYRQYLLFLDSHPEEYLKYLAWKGHYEVGLNQPISIVICVFRWNADRLGPATCVRGFTRSKTGSWEDHRSSKISQRFSSLYYSCRYSCRWCW